MYADDKVKTLLFQQLRVQNSKINNPIWPIFELIQDFIHLHLNLHVSGRLNQKGVIPMKQSNTGFFSNKGDASHRQIIQAGQFLH